ncbi:MAG: SUKH-4 family immunity protein [Pseudomonadota bacterium]
MAFVNTFCEEELATYGFRILRKAAPPQKIRIDQLEIARANIFTTLENAKSINVEFVDFEDQAWIVAKDNTNYILFGRISGEPITIDQDTSRVYIHHKTSRHIANSGITAFSCCFNYLQSMICKNRSKILYAKEFQKIAGLNEITAFPEDAADGATELRGLIEAVDPIGLESGSFWDIILSELEDGRLPVLIQPDFYFANGRMLPGQ